MGNGDRESRYLGGKIFRGEIFGRRYFINSFAMSGVLNASTDFFFYIYIYYDHNDNYIYIYAYILYNIYLCRPICRQRTCSIVESNENTTWMST